MSASVHEIGEAQTLRLILTQLKPVEAAHIGPGDDCAVLTPGACDVVTSDTMFAGTDFRLDWHDFFRLGWKIAAVNLSDVAAMGAVPTALTVALGAPGDTAASSLTELARGIQAACDELAPGCGVVGGDLATAPVVSLAVTAFGTLRGKTQESTREARLRAAAAAGAVAKTLAAPVLRSGAKPGDRLFYAGQGLGLSGLGLQLLLAASGEGELSEQQRQELLATRALALEAHLAPRPPVTLGVAARVAGASAMLDVSDGLALDAWRLARASGVRVELNEAALRDNFGRQRIAAAAELVSLELMLYGGEDHGLLAAFPPTATVPDGFVQIGEVLPVEKGEPSVTMLGERVPERGWDSLHTHS